MSEEVSPNCLKSFALLSDHKHFYLTTCIGILHYFQLHLGTSHCSEFSNLWGNLFFFNVGFFLWIVQKLLNNVLRFAVSKLLTVIEQRKFLLWINKGNFLFFCFYQFRNSLFESFGISAVHGGQWNDLRFDWWRKGANQKRYVRFSILFFVESILHVSMSEVLGGKKKVYSFSVLWMVLRQSTYCTQRNRFTRQVAV